jgi:hypothetical protein
MAYIYRSWEKKTGRDAASCISSSVHYFRQQCIIDFLKYTHHINFVSLCIVVQKVLDVIN